MAEVATGYVTLIPSARGFGRKAEGALSGEITTLGRRQGSKLGVGMGAAMGKTLKRGAKVGAAGAAALVGTALYKGFGRLKAIDEAKAKLSGLGHSTKSVTTIMDDALKSVKGTAFGLDEAATVAASTVAAGVKPGKDLQRTLGLVGDAATIGGTSMAEMGAIFNKVAATGKLSGREIQQLGMQGIPILQLLGKSLGKTPAEVQKLASEGKVGFKEFQAAMEQGLGGAALKSGKTFSGALKNTYAALGRIGANLMSGIFPKMAPMLMGLTKRLGELEPVATKVGQAIGGSFGRVSKFFKGLRSGSVGGSKTMGEFAANFKSIFESIKSYIQTAVTFWRAVWSIFGDTIKTYLAGSLKATLTVLRGALNVITGLFKTFSALLRGDWSAVWAGIKQTLSGAWTVIKGLVAAGWASIKAVFSAAGVVLKAAAAGVWNGVKAAAAAGMQGLVSTVASIPGKIAALAGRFRSAGKTVLNGLLDGLKASGGFVSSIAGKIWGAIKGMLNAAISKINNALNFTIKIPAAPDVHINAGKIPYLAAGGIVSKPTLAMIGEAGPEAVVPLSGAHGRRAAAAMGGSGFASIDPSDMADFADVVASAVLSAASSITDAEGSFAGLIARARR